MPRIFIECFLRLDFNVVSIRKNVCHRVKLGNQILNVSVIDSCVIWHDDSYDDDVIEGVIIVVVTTR